MGDDLPSRMGDRIRKIRKERQLTQGQLGEMVELSADRIQKYEKGTRKPKSEMLKKLAQALDVSPFALLDPDISTNTGALFAMFELESTYNMKVNKVEDYSGTRICLSADRGNALYSFLNEWFLVHSKTMEELESAQTQKEKDQIQKSYDNWKWNFPKSINNNISLELKKEQLKKKIEELQDEYSKLTQLYDELD